jgi:hypothetical protein
MISMPLVYNPAVTAQTSSAQAPKQAATASAALTPDQREAQKHYRIALEALKDNDFATAADELTAASKLAPKNALIWYNLAVVESKKISASTGSPVWLSMIWIVSLTKPSALPFACLGPQKRAFRRE